MSNIDNLPTSGFFCLWLIASGFLFRCGMLVYDDFLDTLVALVKGYREFVSLLRAKFNSWRNRI